MFLDELFILNHSLSGVIPNNKYVKKYHKLTLLKTVIFKILQKHMGKMYLIQYVMGFNAICY